MKKTTYSKLALLSGFALIQSHKLMAQTPAETGELSGLYATISKYMGYGLAVAILICLGMAAFNFMLSDNGAAAAKKYVLGAIGCGVLWALKDTIVSALI